jgi:hypothetical protein
MSSFLSLFWEGEQCQNIFCHMDNFYSRFLYFILLTNDVFGASTILWSCSPRSSSIVTTQAIEDVTSDEYQDVFVGIS